MSRNSTDSVPLNEVGESFRQRDLIKSALEFVQTELRTGVQDSLESSLDDHLEIIITWLKLERVSLGSSYMILENREQDPTPPISFEALGKQIKEVIRLAVSPGKFKLVVTAAMLGFKKLYSKYTDVSRGFLLTSRYEDPVPYNGIEDLLKHHISDWDEKETGKHFPLVLPNRISGPYIIDLLRDKLSLQPLGALSLRDIDRETGNRTYERRYHIGIAPMFEIVEEVVKEYPDREIRRTFILRRKS